MEKESEIILTNKGLELFSTSTDTVSEYYLAPPSPGTRRPTSEAIYFNNTCSGLEKQNDDTISPVFFDGESLVHEKASIEKALTIHLNVHQPTESADGACLSLNNENRENSLEQDCSSNEKLPDLPEISSLAIADIDKIKSVDDKSENMSPLSILKYCERDMLDMKKELYENFQKESEFMQLELQSLNSKYESCLNSKQQLQSLMEEYEKTMAAMIGNPVILISRGE